MAQVWTDSHRKRSVGRLSKAGDIGVATPIYGDVIPIVIMRATDEAAIDQHLRVQYKGAGAVVVANVEANDLDALVGVDSGDATVCGQ